MGICILIINKAIYIFLSQFVKDQRKNWACMVVITRVITTRCYNRVNLVLMTAIIVNQVY